jgi:VCBS repeat-containing protein
MKSILLFAVLIYATLSQAQITPDSAAILDLIQRDYRAFASLDSEAHKANCTTDYILIENGEVWNMDRERMYMRSLKEKAVRKDQFSQITIKADGSFAYAVYQLQSAITRKNQTKNYQWTESVVLKKTDAGWKIALIHSTKVKEW